MLGDDGRFGEPLGSILKNKDEPFLTGDDAALPVALKLFCFETRPCRLQLRKCLAQHELDMIKSVNMINTTHFNISFLHNFVMFSRSKTAFRGYWNEEKRVLKFVCDEREVK